MNVVQFMQSRKKAAESQMDKLAHDLAGGGRSYEDYLIGVGKYRQLKSERDGLQAQLDRARAADAVDEEPGDDVEEIEEPPRKATLARRNNLNPRPWGGR